VGYPRPPLPLGPPRAYAPLPTAITMPTASIAETGANVMTVERVLMAPPKAAARGSCRNYAGPRGDGVTYFGPMRGLASLTVKPPRRSETGGCLSGSHRPPAPTDGPESVQAALS